MAEVSIRLKIADDRMGLIKGTFNWEGGPDEFEDLRRAIREIYPPQLNLAPARSLPLILEGLVSAKRDKAVQEPAALALVYWVLSQETQHGPYSNYLRQDWQFELTSGSDGSVNLRSIAGTPARLS